LNNASLNVVYLASGFPTPDNPSHGVFHQRAANALKDHVSLTVIQFRLFKPGRKLKEEIQENGFKRIILCIPYIPFMESKLYYTNNRLFYFFSKKLVAAIFKKADVVHAGDGNLAIPAAWLKKKFGFKLLAQFIGGDLNQDIIRFYKRSWMRNWKQKLDAVAFNSLSLEMKFQTLFGPHNNSRVIYRGVDTGVFFPAATQTQKPVFYFLGGLPDYTTFTHGRNTKGGINLMKAWSRIDAEATTETKLLFAGPDSDIEMAQTWKQSLQHPEWVELVGKIAPSSIAGFHRSGNVALIPSLEEGMPNVAMEAAATANCIIANPVGGVPEVIVHGVNGLLCTTNDEEGLYQQLKHVIEHPAMIYSLGKAARETVETKFNSKTFGIKYSGYYKDILAKA